MSHVYWPEWYAKAKAKQIYQNQLTEELELIRLHVGWDRIEKVLDVGCGDCRFQKFFWHRDYWGLDKEYNEFDLCDMKQWKDVPSDFDLAFTSLVFLQFDKETSKKIFNQMMKKAKWVFLYEECIEEKEMQHPDDDNKWFHDYAKWSKRIVVWGQSNVNPNWRWYVYRGEVA